MIVTSENEEQCLMEYVFVAQSLGADKSFILHSLICHKINIVPFGSGKTGEYLLGRLYGQGAVGHRPIREQRTTPLGIEQNIIDYEVKLLGHLKLR